MFCKFLRDYTVIFTKVLFTSTFYSVFKLLINRMPGAGIEPARRIAAAQDFKSSAHIVECKYFTTFRQIFKLKRAKAIISVVIFCKNVSRNLSRIGCRRCGFFVLAAHINASLKIMSAVYG